MPDNTETFRVAANVPPAPPAAPAPEIAGPDIDANYDLILLDPAAVRLFRTGGSAVRATVTDPNAGPDRSFLRVAIARAFPFSRPDRYIGLRDGQDRDIGMLVTLEGMDDASRAVVAEELERRYFIPVIQRVNSVKEEFGTTTWEVETDKGPHTFVVQNLRDAVQELTPTRILISDTDGSRWEFPDVRKLDDKSYTVLQRVL